MNTKFIKRSNNDINYDEVAKCSKQLGINYKITELLFSRGFDSCDSINQFLKPDISKLYDPCLLKGMKESVERLEQAIAGNETVVVYGDYDADGVCASAILTLYLVSRGLNVFTHIPNRQGEGYGLSVDSIEKVIDNISPDLILTCDCGISAKNEVAHAMDLGVDVIVTDHHEVSDEIPDCIIVNPKQADCNYPIDNLCGAGVALKLVQAMGGLDEAIKYFDLASIATIADLVPLLDENRLIVQLGLKAQYRNSKGFTALLKDQGLAYGGDILSSDIAFKIAPRINAAGRMGDAYRAFELLTSTDNARIDELIKQINEDNTSRKKLCDELYKEAIGDIENEDIVNNRAIVLSHPSWEKGITGILAARIAGDYKRPSFILVNSGEYYKGTCRSVKNINVYDLLTSVSNLLVEFGGHSQAAGFSIKKENIPAFKESVNNYLKSFPEEYFMPSTEYDIDIDVKDINLSFAKALEMLEPFGNSNTRPIFKTEVESLKVAPCKNNYQHTSITLEGNLNVLAFNHYNSNQFLLGDSKKDLALEISVNLFGKKESVKALLKAVSPKKLYISDTVAKANYIKQLGIEADNKGEFAIYDESELSSLVDSNIYGTLYVAGQEKTYLDFIANNNVSDIYNEFMYSTTTNNYSKVIVSPIFDASLNLCNYEKIIFLDSVLNPSLISYINTKTKAKVYVPKKDNTKDFYNGISTSREVFGKYYEVFVAEKEFTSNNVFSYFSGVKSRHASIDASQFIVCLLVFAELKLIKINSNRFGVSINRGSKSELTNSEIYNKLLVVGDK